MSDKTKTQSLSLETSSSSERLSNLKKSARNLGMAALLATGIATGIAAVGEHNRAEDLDRIATVFEDIDQADTNNTYDIGEVIEARNEAEKSRNRNATISVAGIASGAILAASRDKSK